MFSQQSLIDRFTQSTDNDAWYECMELAENNEVVFIKRPVYENKTMIINIGKNYVKSDILFDSTEKFYGLSKYKKTDEKRLLDFPDCASSN